MGVTLVQLLESAFQDYFYKPAFKGKKYADLASDIKTLAAAFQYMSKNKIVMTIARDSYLSLVSTLATFMAGMTATGPVTLGSDENKDNLIERINKEIGILKNNHKEPDILVLDAYHYSLMKDSDIVRSGKATVISDSPEISNGALNFQEMLNFVNRYKYPDIKPEDIAAILFTSGTSGEEKGVMLSHNAIAQNAYQESLTFGLTSEDKVMFVSHLRHILGLNATLGVITAGGEILFYTNKRELPKELVKNDYSVLVGPPILGENLMKKVSRLSKIEKFAAEVLGKTPLKKWQEKNFRLVFGGAHVPEHLIKFFANHGIKIYEGYGTTEAGIVMVNTPDFYKEGSMGIPLSGKEVSLYNPATGEFEEVTIEDVKVKTRETEKGLELLVGGAQIMSGYLNAESPFVDVDGERYFPTGDIVNVTAEKGKKFFSFRGRMDDIINRKNGEKVSLDELSGYFTEIPYISRCKAVYNPDKDKIVLLVEPDFSVLSWPKYGRSLDNLKKPQRERLEELIRGEVRKWNSNLPEYKRVADMSLAKIQITPTGKIKA